MELTFIKYPSIEQWDRKKIIEQLKLEYPDIDKMPFLITEKIHGANFAIYITKDEVRFARRNGFLEPDDNFYNWQEIVKHNYNINLAIQNVKTFIGNRDLGYVLFGELHGGNIQKGVFYSESPNWLCFDVYSIHSQRFLTQMEMMEFLSKLFLDEISVPHVAIKVGLENALVISPEFGSLIAHKEDNMAEGVVIKPFKQILTLHGHIVYFKKKNNKFKEKASTPKVHKPVDENTEKWSKIAEQYITEPRMFNLFSKEGHIADKKEIGKYIKLFIEDIKQYLVKDYPEFAQLDSKSLKQVFKPLSREIAQMLLKEV